MFGPGRPARGIEVYSVREIDQAEISALATNKVSQTAHVKQLRESHHRVARLIAMGLRTREIAELTGFSYIRISTLRADPAMKELAAAYLADVDDAWRQENVDYYSTISKARDVLGRQMLDRIIEADETGEPIPLGLAARIHGDLADRTGFGKRQTQVNINADFAAMLDKVMARSEEAAKVIEHDPSEAAE